LETTLEHAQINAELADSINGERQRLLGFIRKRVSSPEDAEDILQDVLYQLVSGYSLTEPIEQLSAWLFRSARNRIIDWYRKKRHASLPIESDDSDETMIIAELVLDASDNPDRIFDRSQVWSRLAEALEELPKEQRQVFVMHELEGRSFKEISQLTGASVNTLLSRKRYAVLLLRDRMEELYNDFNE